MRSKDQKSLVAHQTNSSRRRFATGLFVSLAGGLILRPAEAFPRGSDSLFEAATRILQRFGLSVSGAFDQVLERDVLTIDALPDPETQYDFVVNDVDAAGGIQPCVKTAFFQSLSEFTHFEPNVAGGIQPCTKTTVGGASSTFEELDVNLAGGIVPCTRTTVDEPATVFEQFDVNVAGGIQPCSKTTVEEALTTFEVFDPNAVGGIVPCVMVATEQLPRGGVGQVVVEINEPDLNLVVQIGPRTYRLVAGQLVEG
jgi:hypothetical protein